MFQRFGGIDQHSGDLAIDPASATDINNVDLHPVGEVRSRGGMAEVDEAPGYTGAVLGLAMLEAAGGLYHYAAQPNGLSVTPADGSWAWDPAASWTAVDRVTFAHARYGVAETSGDHHPTPRGASLYVATGVGIPFACWGTGSEQLPKLNYSTGKAGVPASTSGGPEWRDWELYPPSGLCLVGRGTTEQMFAWGFPNDPNRIDYSSPEYPWHFGLDNLAGTPEAPLVDGGWFYALPDESDVVIGVIQHLSRIVVFKRRSTVVYSGYPGDDLAVQNIYPVGCTSYDSVVRVGNDLLWWSDQGPVTLFGVQEFGNLQYASIGDPVRQAARTVIATTAASIFAVHDRKNLRVMWFLPDPTSPQVLVYYYDSPRRWTIFTGTLAALTSGLEGLESAGGETIIYGGDADGKVHVLFRAEDDNGDPIASSYTTAWQAAQDHDHRKRMLYVDLMYGADGAIGAAVQTAWDYSLSFTDAGQMVRAIGSAGTGWNEARWWSEADADEWVAHGTVPSYMVNPGYWNNTTQMIARFVGSGTGFIYRLRLSSTGTHRLHFAGWHAFMAEKGVR